MNGCEYYQELISRLIDRQLSEDEQTVLLQHLKSCDECAALYRVFYDVSASLSDQMVEPPEALSANVMAHIRRAEIRKKNWNPWKKVLTAAACVAVILVAAGSLIPKINQRAASVVLSAAPAAEALPEADGAVVYGIAPAEGALEENTAESAMDEAVPQPGAAESPAAATPQLPAEPEVDRENYANSLYPADAAAPPVSTPAPVQEAAPVQDAVSPSRDENSGDMMVSITTGQSGNMLMSAAPPTRVDITTHKRWTKLVELLNGKESKFDPNGEGVEKADEVYKLVLMPDEKLEITVYKYEKELYYTLYDKTATPSPTPTPSEHDKPTVYLAKCSVEDFLKFVETK